jgi:GntR family transcriptional regulator, transcriptional repressor for pyruvate dehydrogenase complex
MDLQVSTPTVSEDVARRLRLLIHSGQLGPGDRLPPERDLAPLMCVGRVSLREAIRLLQARGYVEVRRGATGGTFVTQLDRPYEDWLGQMRSRVDEIGDIIDMRIGLETRAAVLAARRRTDEHLAEMTEAIEQLDASENRVSFRTADARFHGALVRAAQNRRLETAVVESRGEMFLPLDRLVFTAQIESSRAGHTAVYQAVRDRNGELAARAMEAHLEQSRREMQQVIFGGPEPPP